MLGEGPTGEEHWTRKFELLRYACVIYVILYMSGFARRTGPLGPGFEIYPYEITSLTDTAASPLVGFDGDFCNLPLINLKHPSCISCSRLRHRGTDIVAGKGAIPAPFLLHGYMHPSPCAYLSRSPETSFIIPGNKSLASLPLSLPSPTHSPVWLEDLLSAASDRTQERAPRHMMFGAWAATQGVK